MPTAVLVEYVDEHRDWFDEHRDWFGVEPICQVLREAGLKIASSAYYAAKTRPSSARAVRDAELVEDIKVVHRANLGVCGARKVHAALNREGVTVACCTVERLMREIGLQGIRRDKTRKTTVADGAEAPRPLDLVERRFAATTPNQLWVADLARVSPSTPWTWVSGGASAQVTTPPGSFITQTAESSIERFVTPSASPNRRRRIGRFEGRFV